MVKQRPFELVWCLYSSYIKEAGHNSLSYSETLLPFLFHTSKDLSKLQYFLTYVLHAHML